MSTTDDHTPEGHRLITVTEEPGRAEGLPTLLCVEWDGLGESACAWVTAGGRTVAFRLKTADLFTLAAAAREEDLIARAAALGVDAGKDAASWVFDGKTTERTYRTVLKWIEDGDPAKDELADQEPASSEDELLADLNVEWSYDLPLPDMIGAWEQNATDAFWAEVERLAREHLAGEESSDE
jgi:hypothetical protein